MEYAEVATMESPTPYTKRTTNEIPKKTLLFERLGSSVGQLIPGGGFSKSGLQFLGRWLHNPKLTVATQHIM